MDCFYCAYIPFINVLEGIISLILKYSLGHSFIKRINTKYIKYNHLLILGISNTGNSKETINLNYKIMKNLAVSKLGNDFANKSRDFAESDIFFILKSGIKSVTIKYFSKQHTKN